MLSTLSMVGLTAATVTSADFNYAQNGADWASLSIPNNNCGGKNQSPINLVYGNKSGAQKEYKGKLIGWKDDDPKRDYDNGFNLTPVWDGYTVTTDLETDPDALIGFRSQVAQDVFETQTDWRAESFRFHAGSEHTIDGERFDLELQTQHSPREGAKNDFFAAMTSVLFSVENYTAELTWAEERLIDTFFDTMKMGDDDADPSVDFIAIANMMELIDLNNRYVYKGSLTTPPCATDVYWNVVATVYPIKQKHLNRLNNKLKTVTGLYESGNWREIQEVDDHNVHAIYREQDSGVIAGPVKFFQKALTKILEWLNSQM